MKPLPREDTPLKAWIRALERTSNIHQDIFLTLPILIERLAEKFGEAPAVDPAAQLRRMPRSDTGEGFDEITPDDTEPGRDEIDRVRQRRAAQMGIDQGDGDRDSRHPQPNRHVFPAIRHHQADHVAGLQTLR